MSSSLVRYLEEKRMTTKVTIFNHGPKRISISTPRPNTNHGSLNRAQVTINTSTSTNLQGLVGCLTTKIEVHSEQNHEKSGTVAALLVCALSQL
jgi:hypothetical protein